MKRNLFLMLVIAVSASVAHAGVVGVWGDTGFVNTIDSFYGGLPGHSSSILGNLSGLSGVDLLWSVQPTNPYTGGELSAMSSFLDQGGRIAFMGEHGGYMPTQNDNITAALAYFGSGMSIVNLAPDPGYHDATVDNGQILSHSLTEGVDTYNYACFAPLTMTGDAQTLMYGSDLTSVMMGYENIGPGSVFLITDQNVWDNVGKATNDNARMFENLLLAKTGAPPVDEVIVDDEVVVDDNPVIPAPSAVLLAALGLASLAGYNRRKRLN